MGRHAGAVDWQDIGARLRRAVAEADLPAQPSFQALAERLKEPAPAAPMTLLRFLKIPAQNRPLFVVADGMGVDSSAMLEGLRRLGLRPDVILHADTGDEKPETIAFREVRRKWLRSVGFPDLVIVRRKPSMSGVTGKAFATLGEKCVANETLPSLAFGGKKSCSVEWKIKPQEAWLAKHPRAIALWAEGGKVVKAIGYDAGPRDSRRAHQIAHDDRYDYVYPLREWNWDRPRAVAELRATGTPIPPKSACFHCPASKPWEIAEIVRDHPELADRIVEIEDTAKPHLTGIEGLWGRTVKGLRGAIPKPGSMADFIRSLRRDPAMLQRYLDMKPPEDVYDGPVGGIPLFVDEPAPSRQHLTLLSVVEAEPQ